MLAGHPNRVFLRVEMKRRDRKQAGMPVWRTELEGCVPSGIPVPRSWKKSLTHSDGPTESRPTETSGTQAFLPVRPAGFFKLLTLLRETGRHARLAQRRNVYVPLVRMQNVGREWSRVASESSGVGSGANEHSRTPRYLMLMFLAFFLVLGFLIMSAEVFPASINKDARFLAILVHDCFVAFLALASFFFDSKDLIVTGLVLDGGLGRFRHILHLDLRFFMRRLRHHSKGEASADDSCDN